MKINKNKEITIKQNKYKDILQIKLNIKINYQQK